MKFPAELENLSDTQLSRVRRICLALPGTLERLSHGEPTFFVDKKVYVMFSKNHHGDGWIAIWVPVPEGQQGVILSSNPQKYFLPSYVGKQGWVGVDLTEVDEVELIFHIHTAWEMKKKRVRAHTSTNKGTR